MPYAPAKDTFCTLTGHLGLPSCPLSARGAPAAWPAVVSCDALTLLNPPSDHLSSFCNVIAGLCVMDVEDIARGAKISSVLHPTCSRHVPPSPLPFPVRARLGLAAARSFMSNMMYF